MKFVHPITLTDDMVVLSTLAEDDYPAWSSGTTYAVGDRTIKSHRKWESLKAANVAHDPEGLDAMWWVDVGPTNRWAMFDRAVGTSSTGTNPIVVVLSPGTPINALALLSLVAESVRVQVVLNESTLYDRTITLEDGKVTGSSERSAA